MTVNDIDSTPNQLLARVLAEARGAVLADDSRVAPHMAQISEQKLIVPVTVPEAAVYPANMKSDFWVATDTQFYITGWNTNLVKKGDESKSFEDLANPNGKAI